MTAGIKCQCCGADVGHSGLNCEYCGTIATASKPSAHGACSICGRPKFDGQQLCLYCGTIPELSTKLRKVIDKVTFSQNKYRSSFLPAVQQAFRPDEFVLADTYGPSEYYIATNSRVLICSVIETPSLFSVSRQLAGPNRDVRFERITKISPLNEVWPFGDPNHPAVFGLQLETFDGDITIGSVAELREGYFSKDPHEFERRLREAFTAFEDERWLAEHVLYKTGLELSKAAAQAAQVKPPAAEEPPVEAETAEDFSHLTNKSNDEFLSELGIDDVLQSPRQSKKSSE